MICPRCGIINSDEAPRCKRCQGSLAPPPERPVESSQTVAPAARPQTGTSPPEGQDTPPTWQPAPAPAAPPATPWVVPPPPPPPSVSTVWPPPRVPPSVEWPAPSGVPPSGPPQPPPPAGGWPPPSGPPQSLRGSALPTYLPWAILSVLAFWPTGIVAVVYGVLVNRRLAAGDADGATRASHLARTWCWVSLVLGGIALVLWGAGVIHTPYARR